MNRIVAFSYGTLCYLVFLATFLYAIAFLGNVGPSHTIDGAATAPFAQALIINVFLLSLFAIQHSVMARAAFKRWWTHVVPTPVERSTYVLFSSLALLLLFYAWQPMGGVVWDVRDYPVISATMYGFFAAGWLLVLLAIFSNQSFRSVWHAAGLALPQGTALPATPIQDARPLSVRAPSAVRRLALHILGNAHHDGRTSRVCAGDQRIHFDRHSVGGAGPG